MAAQDRAGGQAARPATLARGADAGGELAGRAATGAGEASGQRARLMAEWGAQIRARIEARTRPPAGASGAITLQLALARDGRLLELGVARGSGIAGLDAAVVAAVRSVGRFPAAPEALPGAEFGFSLPLRFEALR
jgi:periplasmic protein TonB